MNKEKCTIIYYTANNEDKSFEKKVIDNIRRVKGTVPVISVSQKPIKFGKNICVGDVGHTYFNAFRQLLIGCEAADTEYVIMAESDCLYPPSGYFNFIPTKDNVIYSHSNVWILWGDIEKYARWKRRDLYFKKDMTHASLIYNRKYLIKLLKKAFKNKPMWSKEKLKLRFYPEKEKIIKFYAAPIVCFKTDKAKCSGTKLDDSIEPIDSLWYWGNGKELKQKMFSK